MIIILSHAKIIKWMLKLMGEDLMQNERVKSFQIISQKMLTIKGKRQLLREGRLADDLNQGIKMNIATHKTN